MHDTELLAGYRSLTEGGAVDLITYCVRGGDACKL